MPTSLVDADSFLVVDVGSITTRAMLFDVVDGRYRFLAVGSALTTAAAPFHDVSEGVRQALDQVQAVSGRTLVGQDEQLIIPTNSEGNGVDKFAVTLSAGPPLKIVAIGLLENVSLESISRLATTTYCGELDALSLNDRRKPEARMDAILRMQPDLILIGGGTEGGASQSVLKLLESVELACFLSPEGSRPEILFAGNQELQDKVKEQVESLASLHFAPNVRPTLEVEQLDAAQSQMSTIFCNIRSRQIPGVHDLAEMAGGNLLPTSAAFARLIRFLSRAHPSAKGVLGVDVGASATTIAAAFAGELSMGVYPALGLGPNLARLLDHVPLDEIAKWSLLDVEPGYLHEYIYNKALYPGTLPHTVEDLSIEQALARVAMQAAVQKASGGFPAGASRSGPDLLPWFEPIVASGSVLTRAPNLAHSLLMLLDGLQPTGATTIVLDQNHLSPALGVAAAVNPILAVQVLDSSTFLHLGTVISPVGHARPGVSVLRLKMTYENGQETTLDVKQGTLEVLPLPIGQTAQLQLQPLHRYDVGMGAPGRSGRLRVMGGALGVVVDARGRPLQLPDDLGRRREMMKKWLWTLGG